jgi:3-oxoacyl-ACP reductase-like protein
MGTCLGVLGGVILALMAVATKKRIEYSANSTTQKELTDGESSAETSLDRSDDV